MVLTIGVFVIAVIAALLAWGRLGAALAVPGLQKENYRGVVIFAVSGIFVVSQKIVLSANLGPARSRSREKR